MKTLLTVLFCLWAPLMGADKDKPATPKEVMKLFVGTWDSEMSITPDSNPAKVQTSKMIRVRKWSPEKNFVVEQATPDAGVWVLAYDPNKKNYRSVFVTPEFTSSLYGTWNDPKKIMTWHGHEDNGNLLKGHHRVVDKDHHEWELNVFSGDKLLLKLAGKHKRRSRDKK